MTRGRVCALAALGVVVACGAPSAAAAATIAVTPNTADSTASCSTSPCPNLRSAVAYANAHPGTTLQLAAGRYSLSLGELLLSANSTTIAGQGAGATKIVQTATSARVLEIGTSATVVLDQLEVTGGNLAVVAAGASSEADGGGIFDGGGLTLNGVLVDHNSATGGDGADGTGTTNGVPGLSARGGGIFSDGSLTINNSSVVDNTAAGGAGGSNLVVNGTSGAGSGGSGLGGGVYSGQLNASDSTFASNLASGGDGGNVNTTNVVYGGGGGFADGGGIDVSSSQLERVTLANNTAAGGIAGANQANARFDGPGSTAVGGGLDDESGATLINSTVFGNVASTPNAVGSQYFGLSAIGGGIALAELGGHSADLKLFSDTIDANSATSPGSSLGGDLYLGGNAPFTTTGEFRDTIIAAGQDTAGGKSQVNDCFYEGHTSVSDYGYNLDDAAQVQGTDDPCGLSATTHSALGVDPQLAALGDNGGPTQTMALGGTSPALGAGSECLDPNTHDPNGPFGYGPLKVDQRGLPRANPCDIGAFEHQSSAKTANTSPPTISGTPSPGDQLTCNPGVWTGTGLSYAYQWKRDGTAIPSATGPSYVVQSGDAGHTLGCVVTASGASGTASATSSSVTVPASGGGGTGGGGGGTLTPGKVSIPAQTVVIGHHHRAVVKLRCTGQRPCVGVIRITVTQTETGAYIATAAKKGARKHKSGTGHKRRHKHKVVLAHGTFTIEPGNTTKVTLKVLNIGESLVHSFGHMNATIRVVATGAVKPITRVVTIK